MSSNKQMGRFGYILLLTAVVLCATISRGYSQGGISPSEIARCSGEEMTITVNNSDAVNVACNIVVTNGSPAGGGITHMNGDSIITLDDGATHTVAIAAGESASWDIDTVAPGYCLPPGGTLTILFDVAASGTATGGDDTITIDYQDCSDPGPPPASCTSAQEQETTPITVTVPTTDCAEVDLVVNVDADQVSYYLGDLMTYTVEVTSRGPDDITGPARMELNVPGVEHTAEDWAANVTCVAEAGAVCPTGYTLSADGSTLIADIDTLPVLGKLTFTAPVHINKDGYPDPRYYPSFYGQMQVQATITPYSGDTELYEPTNTAYTMVDILAPDVDWSVEITGPDVAFENTTVNYDVTLCNEGRDPTSVGLDLLSLWMATWNMDEFTNTEIESVTCKSGSETGTASCDDAELFQFDMYWWEFYLIESAPQPWIPEVDMDMYASIRMPGMTKLPGNSCVTFDVKVNIGEVMCSSVVGVTRELTLSSELYSVYPAEGLIFPDTYPYEFPRTRSNNYSEKLTSIAAGPCLRGDLAVNTFRQSPVVVELQDSSTWEYTAIYTNQAGDDADNAIIDFYFDWPAPGATIDATPTCTPIALCPTLWTVSADGDHITGVASLPVDQSITVIYTGTTGENRDDICRPLRAKVSTTITPPMDFFDDLYNPDTWNYPNWINNRRAMLTQTNVGAPCLDSYDVETTMNGPYTDSGCSNELTGEASPGDTVYYKTTITNLADGLDFSWYYLQMIGGRPSTYSGWPDVLSTQRSLIIKPISFDPEDRYYTAWNPGDPPGLPMTRGTLVEDSGVRCTNALNGAICPESVGTNSYSNPIPELPGAYFTSSWNMRTSNIPGEPVLPDLGSLEFCATYRIPPYVNGTCTGYLDSDIIWNVSFLSKATAKTDPLSPLTYERTDVNNRASTTVPVRVVACPTSLEVDKTVITPASGVLGLDGTVVYEVVLTNTSSLDLDLPRMIDVLELDGLNPTISCTGTTLNAVCPTFTPVAGIQYLADGTTVSPIPVPFIYQEEKVPSFDFVWGAPGELTMPAGSTVTFQVTVQYPEGSFPSPHNTVYFTGDESSLTASWPYDLDEASVTVPSDSELGITKKVDPTQPDPGEVVTFTVNVVNFGDYDIDPSYFSDTMHASLQATNPTGFGNLTCRTLTDADGLFSSSVTVGVATCPPVFIETPAGISAANLLMPPHSGYQLTYTAIAPLIPSSTPNIANMTHSDVVVTLGDASAKANLSVLTAVVTHDKTGPVVTALGGNTYNVVYTITVENLGDNIGQYTLTDTPTFDDDITINSGNYTTDAPGHPTANPGPVVLPTTNGTATPLATNLPIAADATTVTGTAHVYTLTYNVTLDLSGDAADPGGDNTYTACESGVVGDPTINEGLYNATTLDTNDDGIFEEEDEVCGDLPVIGIEKTFVSATDADGDGVFDVVYSITVGNAGGLASSYSLTDTFSPNDNVVVSAGPTAVYDGGGSTSTTAETVEGFPGIITGTNGTIEPGLTDIFTVTATVSVDLTAGDGTYEGCTLTTPVAGEGLYNEASLVAEGVTITDEACGELPAVTLVKDLVSVTPSATLGKFDVVYSITVGNAGGLASSYSLTDTFSPNDNVVVSAGPTAVYDGGGSTSTTAETVEGFPGIITGTNGTIEPGLTDIFTVTATVSVDLTAGDGTYEGCTLTTPVAGEGLYNEASLVAEGVTITDEACGELPAVTLVKDLVSVTPSATLGKFDVVYSITVGNAGGLASSYSLTDTFSPNDNVVVSAGPTAVYDGGGSTSTTAETVEGFPGIITGTNGTIEPGLTDIFTVTATVSVDLTAGDGTYEGCTLTTPVAGEGLYNEASLVAEGVTITDEACGELPAVTLVKDLVSVTPSATLGEFDVVYSITVGNAGGLASSYSLTDTFSPNDNVVVSAGPAAVYDGGGSTSTTAETVEGFPGIITGTNGTIEPGLTDIFTVTATVSVDLTAGDGTYEGCTLTTPVAGEGLYNEASLVAEGVTITDEACGELPAVTLVKDLVSVTPSATLGEFDVVYSITVGNAGGLASSYSLTDTFSPNDNVVVSAGPAAVYDGGGSTSTTAETVEGFPGIITGTNGTIEPGLTDIFTVTATVSVDLTAGDGTYEGCTLTTPVAGEGLYNEASLVAEGVTITDEACGELPAVTLVKDLVSVTPSATLGEFDVVYSITVGNAGGLASSYSLTDTFSPNDNVVVSAGPAAVYDGGGSTSTTAETVEGFPGIITGTNGTIEPGLTDIFTVTATVSVDLTAGDGTYEGCTLTTPVAGEGLYNEASLVAEGVTITDEACGELPAVTLVKDLVSVTPSATLGEFDVVYSITVGNAGGLASSYSLTDTFSPNDNVVVSAGPAAVYDGGGSTSTTAETVEGFPGIITGTNGTIEPGLTDIFTVTATVSVDLTAGDGTYEGCTLTTPVAGEGLYNEASLVAEGVTITDEACGELPAVTLVKDLVSVTPSATLGEFDVVYSITVGNAGGLASSYSLTDTFSPNDNVVVSAGPAAVYDGGGSTSTTAETVEGFPGIITGTNGTIEPGLTDIFTVTATVSVDLTAGDGTYEGCTLTTPVAGEGLYNEASLVAEGVTITDEACGELPAVTLVKDLVSVTPSATLGEFDVVYSITVGNAGGLASSYSLTDTFSPNDNVVVSAGPAAVYDGGGSTSTTAETVEGFPGIITGTNGTIEPGLTDIFTVTATVSVDLTAGDGTYEGCTLTTPVAGEGLYNEASLVAEGVTITDEACGELPAVTLVKDLVSVTPSATLGEFDVVYSITVGNAGGLASSYSLTDTFSPNDNVVVSAGPAAVYDGGGSTSTTAETVEGFPGIITGTNGTIEPGLTDIFTVTATVSVDLTAGDGTYEGCTLTTPVAGEGLYNEASLVAEGVTITDEACGELPAVTLVKDLVSVTPSATLGEFDVVYSITVGNAGGLASSYSLTDTFSPNDNVVVSAGPTAVYDGGGSTSTTAETVEGFPGIITGTNGTIEPGLTDIFTVTATVSVDLTAGDGTYEGCTLTTPVAGEGLYNEASLVAEGVTITDEACGELPAVTLVKDLVSVTPSATLGEFDVVYSITVGNAGGLASSYSLTDTFSPNDNVVVSAGPTAVYDGGGSTSTTAETVEGFPGIITGTNGTIEPGLTDIFTVTATVSVDLTAGDGTYEGCTLTTPVAGEGLYNEASLVAEGVTITDEACGELPAVTLVKDLVSVTPSATLGEFDVVYSITVGNAGGLASSYSLTDTFSPNDNVVVSAGPTAVYDGGGSTSTTAETVEGFPGIITGTNGTIEPGLTDIFTVTATVSVDLTAGDGTYEGCTLTTPVAGEGLYNEASLVAEGVTITDEACGELPAVTLVKDLVSVTPSATLGEFDVVYSITVGNAGGLASSYSLTDTFSPNDNVVVSAGPTAVYDGGGSTSTTAETVEGFPGIITGTNGTIEPGLTDIFTVTATVSVDLTAGDGTYEGCTLTTPVAGEGLYNEASLVAEGVTITDEACGELPAVTLVKDLVSVTPSATLGKFDVVYSITVGNAGGLASSYSLTDTFSPNDNVVVSAGPTAVYDGGGSTSTTAETVEGFPGIITGTNGTIEPGLTDIFTVTATVSVDLTAGDGTYEGCTLTTPVAGEGLYNEASLVAEGVTITDEACGELPAVTLVKDLVSVTPSATLGKFDVVYSITVGNAGGLASSYSLTDTFSPNDNVVVSAGPTAVYDGGGSTSTTAETVEGFPGIITGTNGTIEPGLTDIFTVTATVSVDLTAGDGTYEGCTLTTPVAGEGLYNEASLVAEGVTITDEACGELPAVTLVKDLVSVTPSATLGEFDVVYSITVGNAGGLASSYSLTDTFSPNDNVVVSAGPAAVYDGGGSTSTTAETVEGFPGIITGTNGTIEPGLTDIFTVTATVSVDLTAGDGTYEGCTLTTPVAGEGLYNEASLVAEGVTITDEACGEFPPMSLGSIVWQDNNGDGIQDAGEPPIEGATVTLVDENGDPVTDLDGILVDPQTTGADGLYYFDNLPPGEYKVQVTSPAGSGLVPTPNQTTTDDDTPNDSNIASEPSSGTYESGVFTLEPGTEPMGTTEPGDDQDDVTDADGNMTVDFGLVPPMSLGSIVWQDNNGDGIQDAGEPPIEGATVTLVDENGDPVTDLDGILVDPQTTGADGLYYFDNLPPGEYKVQVTSPAGSGLVPTPNQTTTDDDTPNDSNIASEPSSGTYESGVFTLEPGTEPMGTTESGDDQDDVTDADGNMTVDFGLVPPMSLGSIVWRDNNGDGIQDAGEPPIEGATVTLVDENGDPVTDLDGILVDPQTTGADGLYYFDNLPPGEYKVQVTSPAGSGLVPTPNQTTTDDDTPNDSNIASEPSSGTYESGVFTLEPGTEPMGTTEPGDDQDDVTDADGNMTVDFGLVPPMSLGSIVWRDNNGDGIQDAGEPPIEGATVTLVDENGDPVTDLDGILVDPQTTGADGLYYFDNLPPGEYKVQVTSPAGSGLVPTPNQTTTDDDTPNDSNIASEPSSGTYESGVFTLEPGTEPMGTTEPGDDQDDVTDADGNMTVDFGLVPPMSLGSIVWRDNNGDGIQDAGEPPIEGATVTLVDENGDPVTDLDGILVDPQTTGADGLYYFDNLPPGEYKVQVTSPAGSGLVPTPNQTTTDDDTPNDSNIASEPSSGTYESGVFTLEPGTEPMGTTEPGDDQDDVTDADGNMTVDFGLVPPMSLGSIVWRDNNGDGIQDAGEPPIEGATVTLVDENGDPVTDLDGILVDPQTTGADGLYYFDNLPPGEYKVQVTSPAGSGLVPTPNQTTTDDDTPNDSNIASEPSSGTYESGVFTLEPGTEPMGTTEPGDDQDDVTDADGNMTVDFGLVPPMSLGSIVWQDNNGDGIQDAGEPPIEGATVTLVDENGDPVTDLDGILVDPQTTGADGLYYFDNLPPGEYKVQVTSPAGSGLVPTPNQTTTDDDTPNDSNIASEPSSGTYESGVFTLEPGTEPMGTTEPGDDQDDVTDADGNMTVDFGLVPPMSLGSIVWQDNNGDGIQDAGEPPIEGATVTLVDENGDPVTDLDGILVDPQTTGADGLYYFDNLPPGEYKVQVTSPAGSGLVPTPNQTTTDDDTPNDSNIASEPSSGTYESGVFTLEPGTEPMGTTEPGDDQDDVTDADGNMTVDFGLVPPMSIGSSIWRDDNGDGVQDAGEPGIEGATVELLLPDGSPVVDLDGIPVPSVTTGTDGRYNFTNLPPGDYIVQVTPPYEYLQSPVQEPDANTDLNTDSNISTTPSTGVYRSGTITLHGGSEPTGEEFADGAPDQDGKPDEDGNMTVDFGFGIPRIDIEKATNGEDADASTGPILIVGDSVTWIYVVTNTGSLPLDTVTVVDDVIGSVTCPQTILAISESMTCTMAGIVVEGQYENIATVTGTPIVPVRDLPLPTVTDTDPSHYVTPDIDVEKATNGEDADNPTGPVIPVGGAVTWTYVVTNTGNTTLLDVTLVDDKDVTITCPDGLPIPILVPGQVETCTATGTAVAGQYENNATTVGTPVVPDFTTCGCDPKDPATWPTDPSVYSPIPGIEPVTDTDPSHYIAFTPVPDVDVEKSTNREDADNSTGPKVPVGDSVVWEYVVTNTGNTALTGVTLTDDDLGVTITCPGGLPIPLLLPGQSVTCTATGTAVAGQYENIASVSGTPALPNINTCPICDLTDPTTWPSDPAGYVPADVDKPADTDPSHYTADPLPVVSPPQPVVPQPAVPQPAAPECNLTVAIVDVNSKQLPDAILVDPDPRFNTARAMYAVSEMQNVSEKLSAFGVSGGDPLLKTMPRYLSTYAGHNLGSLTFQSGMGLGMELSPPMISKMAADAGLKETPEMHPLKIPFEEGWPVQPDHDSLLWSTEDVETDLVPEALGQTLAAQSALLPELAASDNAEERFAASVMAMQMRESAAFAAAALFKGKDGAYMPHRMQSDANGDITVKDASSRLADQAAMLRGLVTMSRAFTEAGIPRSPIVSDLTAKIWNAMETMHWNESLGIYETSYDPETDKRSGRVEVYPVQLAALALHELTTDSAFGPQPAERLKRVLGFVRDHLVAEDGGVYAAYDTESGKIESEEGYALGDMAGALRILLLSDATVDADAANTVFAAMEKDLWDHDKGMYRDHTKWDYDAEYTPVSVATTMAALTAMADKIDAKGENASAILGKLSRFHDRVLYRSGLQREGNRLSPFMQADRLIVGDTQDVTYSREPVSIPSRLLADPVPETGLGKAEAPVLVKKIRMDLIPDDAEALLQLQDSDEFRLDREAPRTPLYLPPARLPKRSWRMSVDPETVLTATGLLYDAANVMKAQSAITDNAFMTDPSILGPTADRIADLVGDYEPMPPEKFVEKHWPALAERYNWTGGEFSPDGPVTAEEVGIFAETAGRISAAMPANHAEKEALKQASAAAARFIMEQMNAASGEVMGLYPATASSDARDAVEDGIGNQTAPILGLLRAYEQTGDAKFLDGALAIYRAISEKRWDHALGIFLSREDRMHLSDTDTLRYQYTDLDIAATLYALSELLRYTDGDLKHRIAENAVQFATHLLPEPAGVSDGEVTGVDVLLGGRNKVYPGDTLGITIVVKNTDEEGNPLGALADLSVTNYLPGGFAYVPRSGRLNRVESIAPEISGTELRFNVDQTDDEGNITIEFNAKMSRNVQAAELKNKIVANGRTKEGGEGLCKPAFGEDVFNVGAKGGIKGKVFTDIDGNGAMGPGEKGLDGIRVLLDGNRDAFTDHTGAWNFDDLIPGEYEIRVDIATVPAGMRTTNDLLLIFPLKEGKTFIHHFGVESFTQLSE